MTLERLELEVDDVDRARRLFVDLLGATVAGARDGDAFAVDPRGGASVSLRSGDGPRAVLRRLVVAADAEEVADTRSLLGTAFAVVAPGQRPAVEHAPRGAAGVVAFDHVCFAVASLRDALELLRDGFGGQVVFGGHNRLNGTLSSQVDLGGGTRIELLEPTRDDAVVARYLDRFGPGMHHLTWKVADVARAVVAAQGLGFPVTDTDLASRRHWRETYLPPSTTLGLLVQLAWTDHSHDAPLDESTIAAILDRRVDSHDYTMQRQPT